MNQPNVYLSPTAAAHLLGVAGSWTLRAYERRGVLHAVRTPGNHRRYAYEELLALKETLVTKPEGAIEDKV